MRLLSRVLPLSILLIVTGCASLSPTPAGQIATPVSGTIEPAAGVRFVVQPPPGTPDDAELTLVLLDPVTDIDINAQRIPMDAVGDGHWAVSLNQTVGSLLYYRYEKSEPVEAIEVSAQGAPIDYRNTYVSGPGEIHEMIARWSGEPFQGETGRILGQIISADDSEPLSEMIVNAGGHLTFTDGEGRFRVDDLPPGLHTITAFSPTGHYKPHQQEALITANTTTPVKLGLESADPLVVTFQVTVPADTPEQAQLRLAGNVAQLGFRFNRSNYGSFQSVSQMPALVRVDPEHFLGVFTLYNGTNLQYKYTLGDGVWNAERSTNGAFVTRSVRLDTATPTLRDRVDTWSDNSGNAIRFEVAIPEWTPSGDTVAIQFKVNSWRAPLPMWPHEGLWTYHLFSPASFEQEIEYRFCRNMLCGIADEIGFSGPEASGRRLSQGLSGTLVQQVVEDWQWLDRAALQQKYPSDPLPMEYLIRGGFAFSKAYNQAWQKHVTDAFNSIGENGANEVILSPAWTWTQNNPFPILSLDPTSAPFDEELRELVKLGRDRGLHVAIRPSFHTVDIGMDNWWLQGIRNQLWWDLWFEEYRSFILTYASWAQQNGVEKLIIGGPEVIPALPFSSLPDGNPSGVPVDSEIRWRSLIEEIQARFAGELAFELDVQEELSLIPPFIDLFDQVHLFWHSPIEEGETITQDIQQAAIEAQLNRVLNERALEGKQISFILAYLSLEDSGTACPPLPDGSCRPLTDFSQGQIIDIDLEVDLDAQAQVYTAMLRAIADEPQIRGVYSPGFYPAVILHDKSLSVYGKPAQDVLAGWLRDLPLEE
jgi:hypothetical protein